MYGWASLRHREVQELFWVHRIRREQRAGTPTQAVWLQSPQSSPFPTEMQNMLLERTDVAPTVAALERWKALLKHHNNTLLFASTLVP